MAKYRVVNSLASVDAAYIAGLITYAIWNRQALSLLAQLEPILRSYKRMRARLVLDCYIRLTPRNGKYTPEIAAERQRFESALLELRADTLYGSAVTAGRRAMSQAHRA